MLLAVPRDELLLQKLDDRRGHTQPNGAHHRGSQPWSVGRSTHS
jgi:hypothetical protein